MGQTSSQVHIPDEDAQDMDDDLSSVGFYDELDREETILSQEQSRAAQQERDSSPPQRKRKADNRDVEEPVEEEGADMDQRIEKKLKKAHKNKSRSKKEGKRADGSPVRSKKRKHRKSDAVDDLQKADRDAEEPAQSNGHDDLENIASSAAHTVASEPAHIVSEFSDPLPDAASTPKEVKKKKKKSKSKRPALETSIVEDEHNGADIAPGLQATPGSTWTAVNITPSVPRAEQSNGDDSAMQSKQNKKETAAEESMDVDPRANINTIVRTNTHSEKEKDLDATPRQNTRASPLEEQVNPEIIPFLNSQARTAGEEMDLDATQSQDAEANPGDEAVDPETVQARNRLDAAAKELPQIGVYSGDEPSSAALKRKRRLPVDDEPVDTPSKKAKKTAKAKAPLVKSKATKAAATSSQAPGEEPGSLAQAPKRAASTNDSSQVSRVTDAELAIIKNQMLKHREINDITQEEQNRLIHSKAKAHQDLFNMILEELPGRNRWAIIKFCRRKFHNFQARGKWSTADDDELREAHREAPNRWTKIGERLNRHPEDCRDRWRNYLICGDNMITDPWQPHEEVKLKDVVAECVSHIREMRLNGMLGGTPGEVQQDSPDDIELVDWQRVSEKMGRTRSRLQCRQKWKRMIDRENPEKRDVNPVTEGRATWRVKAASQEIQDMSFDDKLTILRGIRDSEVGREGKIIWKSIGDEAFQDRWDTKALKIAFIKLKNTVKDPRSYRLQELVALLVENLEKANGEDPTEKAFRDGAQRKKARKPRQKNLSEEVIRPEDDDEEDDEDTTPPSQPLSHRSSRAASKEIDTSNEAVENQIIQELPKPQKPKKRTKKSKESSRQMTEDTEAANDAIEDQIMQELPRPRKSADSSSRPSSEKKKLSERLARRSESVDSVGNIVPSDGPEVPESDHGDEHPPKVQNDDDSDNDEEKLPPSFNGDIDLDEYSQVSVKAANDAHRASDSESDGSNSDLDEEIPARRLPSIAL